MQHKELVLSKNPLRYYPLDGNLLNYANAGATAASSSTVHDGTNDTSAHVFFKGQPLVRGLKNACALKNSSSKIEIPAEGMFSLSGGSRNTSMEFYMLGEVAFTDSKEDMIFLQYNSDATEFQMGWRQGAVYIRIKTSDDDASRSARVYSDLPNRPKQIVINWSPTTLTFLVNGVQSNPIDITDVEWATTSSEKISLLGTGSSTTSYKRFQLFNAVSIFPKTLTVGEVNELRAAAWGDPSPYGVVRSYNGDFIECSGSNIQSNGKYTIDSNIDWLDNIGIGGNSTRDGVLGWPQYRMPTYTGGSVRADVTSVNSRAVLPVGVNKHIDYNGASDLHDVKAIGAVIANKGAGQYTSKEYVLTIQKGTSFFGIYTQSQNAYYEVQDSITGESSSGTIKTGIDGYSSTGIFFAGLDFSTGEVLVADLSSTQTYATFYAAGSTGKVAVDAVNSFSGDVSMRVGGDIRVGEDSSTEFTGYMHCIYVQNTVASTAMGFYPSSSTTSSFNPETGFIYAGRALVNFAIPCELIGKWDGATTDPGAVVSYMYGDTGAELSHSVVYSSSPSSGAIVTAQGPTYGASNMINVKTATGTDSTGNYYQIKLNPYISGAPFVYPTIDKVEVVSYKVNSNNYVEVKDGRSRFPLEASKWMTVPQGNLSPHQRGPNDGLRNVGYSSSVGSQPRVVIPSSDTLYGLSFMVWIDGNPADYTVDGSEYSLDVVSVSGAGGGTLTANSTSTSKFYGVDIRGTNGIGRLYINGAEIALSGSSPYYPTTPGQFKLNSWNQIFLAFSSGLTGGRTITFDKSYANNGSYFTSFELGACINDIAIFTSSDFPTTNTAKDTMAARLAAPYFGTDITQQTSGDIRLTINESSLSVNTGDGIVSDKSRQWTSLGS